MGLLTIRAVQVAAIMAGLSLGALAEPGAAMSPLSGFEASAGGTGHSQGYLGVDIRDVGDARVSSLKLKDSRGAEVIRVDHDGPAGNAGLREQDVILQVNGVLIEGEEQLRKMLRETPAGRTVTLVLSRAGQVLTVTTHLANRMDVEKQAWQDRWVVPVPADDLGAAATPAQSANSTAPSGSSKSSSSGGKGQSFLASGAHSGHEFIEALTPGSTYTGVVVEPMAPQLAEFFGTTDGGLLVSSVDANSPAAVAGLKAGDVVIRANSLRMASNSDWSKVVRENKGKTVEVVVLRDRKEQTVKLIPDSKKRSAVDNPGGLGKSTHTCDFAFNGWGSFTVNLG